MDYIGLGNRIRESRTLKGLSQEALSELCELSPSYIGVIERADKKPSIETIVKIAVALGVSLDVLFADSLNIPSDDRVKELTPIIKGLDNNQFKLVTAVVKDISAHFTQVKG